MSLSGTCWDTLNLISDFDGSKQYTCHRKKHLNCSCIIKYLFSYSYLQFVLQNIIFLYKNVLKEHNE